LRKEKEKVQEKKEERKNKSNNYYFLSKNTPLKFALTTKNSIESFLRAPHRQIRKRRKDGKITFTLILKNDKL